MILLSHSLVSEPSCVFIHGIHTHSERAILTKYMRIFTVSRAYAYTFANVCAQMVNDMCLCTIYGSNKAYPQLDAFIHTISVKMRIHFFDISMSSVWYTIFTIYTHIWMWHKSPRVWCNNKNNSNNIHVQLNGNKQNTRHKSHVKLQGKKIVWLLINNKYE